MNAANCLCTGAGRTGDIANDILGNSGLGVLSGSPCFGSARETPREDATAVDVVLVTRVRAESVRDVDPVRLPEVKPLAGREEGMRP